MLLHVPACGLGPEGTVCLGFHLSSDSVLTYSILWVTPVGLLWLIFNA